MMGGVGGQTPPAARELARELHVVYLCAIISCTFCFQFNA